MSDSGDLWTTDDVRRYLGLATLASARAQIAEWRIEPAAREPGRSGQNLYDPAQITARHEARKGAGYRSDLHGDRQ